MQWKLNCKFEAVSYTHLEIQTQDEQAAWELGGKGYLAIQSCEDGWDYTLYHSDYSVMDGCLLYTSRCV